MAHNFLSFLNIFCLYKSSPPTRICPKKPENEILHSKPLDLALTKEPVVLILQKNIQYKIICSLQPIYFQSYPNKKSFFKNKSSIAYSIKPYSPKFQNCLDFRGEENLQSSIIGMNDNLFHKSEELFETILAHCTGNFIVIYNYCADVNAVSLFDQQAFLKN